MLPHDRVVFAEFKLAGLGAGILLGHIEEAGIGSGNQFDLNSVAFGHDSLPLEAPEDAHTGASGQAFRIISMIIQARA
ncbi:Hypothetical protein GbCGDNIH6_5110 [Granulibacter bethesdensis]|nr:Hypothetical protein GbCGDNIH6_5110 [Granulibacter bethesdensis]